MLQGTENHLADDARADGVRRQEMPDVAPPEEYGKHELTSRKVDNTDEVYVENQYGEMEASSVTPERRWSRGPIPEVQENITCTDMLVGKAEEIIGKMTKKEDLVEKGASRQGVKV